MCAASAEAFSSATAPDHSESDRQWEAFKTARRRRPVIYRLFQKKAAAVVAVLIASCSAIVVGVSLSRSGQHGNGSEATQTAIAAMPEADEGIWIKPTVNDTVMVFEDETLERILDRIAPYYNAKVDLASSASSNVRLFLKWDSTTELPELIEHLNSFERINIFLKDDTITDY